jgi:phage baseplate assembly protein V
MDHLWNMIKAQAGGLDGLAGVVRYGLVSSFDPAAFAARVLLQPENILSGWLPVVSPWVGGGWGLAAPLPPGTQVVIVCQEGDAEQGMIIGAVWSAVDKPLDAPVGELWLQHQSGSFIRLLNNGTIAIEAALVNVAGNLMVSGDISDQNGSHGTLAALRNAHDGHTHPDAQGGNTGLPSLGV